jgi:hypothetical protein
MAPCPDGGETEIGRAGSGHGLLTIEQSLARIMGGMKIEGPRPTGAAGGSRKTSATGASGFALPADETQGAAATTAARPMASLEAMMALQAEGFDPHRRGRQVKRGAKTLDALESIVRAQLEGAAPNAGRLSLVALQGQTEATGDPGLDAVLADIDVRAAVELAKLEMADRARKRA